MANKRYGITSHIPYAFIKSFAKGLSQSLCKPSNRCKIKLLSLEQTELLAGDRQKLLSENEKLEKQQKKQINVRNVPLK